MGWDQVNLPIIGMASLVTLGFPFALLYGASNTVSGITDQDESGLYWLDHIPSVVAWMSINVTAGFVLFGLFQANSDIVRVIQESFALQLLLALVVFSWIDVLWLQRYKHRMLREQLQNPNAPQQPHLATYAAQPQSRGGLAFGTIVATLLVLGLIGGAIYASGLDADSLRSASIRPWKSGVNDSEKNVPTCSRFVRNVDGVAVYQLHHDC